MHRRPLAALSLVLSLAACSSSETGNPPPGETVQRYSFQFTTAPGEETHWCQYARMPKGNDDEVVVTGYEWTWENMHHWGLYRTTADLPSNVSFDEPFDCFAPGGMKYAAPAALVLGGGEKGEIAFPSGTGFGFEPSEVVIFQAHTLNTTDADITAKIDVDVKSTDPKTVENRLGLIQFYDPYIVVPAHTEAKAQMRCKIPSDMTVALATTHQHTRGTGVEVFLDPPGDARTEKPFVESKDWEHPTVSGDTLKLEAGSHVRTICSYLGDAHDVYQGQDKLDNEMCMFIGYYYPVVEPSQQGVFENCIQDLVPGGVGDEYGTGVKTCSEMLACIQTCPPGEAPKPGDGRVDVGPCWQTCMVDSCPSATAPFGKLALCISTKCAEACSGGDCPSCVLANCAAEYGGCSGHACAAPAP